MEARSNPAEPETSWRIDDLAQRTGLTVDTIRYYQREGLLPAPVRRGRTKLYGPDHLSRLEQIRALQARRFSLAAIREVLATGEPALIEEIFLAGRDRTYETAELEERTGADAPLLAALHEIGALGPDAERTGYDTADADLVRAVLELESLGLPRHLVVRMVDAYVQGITAMQRRVVELILRAGEGDDPTLPQRVATKIGDVLPRMERIERSLHQHILERVALDQIRGGEPT